MTERDTKNDRKSVQTCKEAERSEPEMGLSKSDKK